MSSDCQSKYPTPVWVSGMNTISIKLLERELSHLHPHAGFSERRAEEASLFTYTTRADVKPTRDIIERRLCAGGRSARNKKLLQIKYFFRFSFSFRNVVRYRRVVQAGSHRTANHRDRKCHHGRRIPYKDDDFPNADRSRQRNYAQERPLPQRSEPQAPPLPELQQEKVSTQCQCFVNGEVKLDAERMNHGSVTP